MSPPSLPVPVSPPSPPPTKDVQIKPPTSPPAQKHVLTKQSVVNIIPTLEKIPAEVQLSNDTEPSSRASTETVVEVESHKETLLPPSNSLEPTPSLSEFEELEMQSAFSAVSDVGKTMETGIKSQVGKIVTDGMKQVDELKDSAVESIKGAQKGAMDAINTEIVKPVGDKINELNEKKNEMLNDVAEGVKGKTDSVIHTLESKFHLGDSKDANDDADDKMLFKKNEMTRNLSVHGSDITDKHDGEIGRNQTKSHGTPTDDDDAGDDDQSDDSLNRGVDSGIEHTENVTFINDGVDVTNDVAKSMKDELDEMTKGDDVLNEVHSKNEDSLLGEKLIGVKPLPSNLLDSKESTYTFWLILQQMPFGSDYIEFPVVFPPQN